MTGQLHVLLMDHAKFLTERVSLKHYEAINCPADVSVQCTGVGRTSATDPAIQALLSATVAGGGCSGTANGYPNFFTLGTTPVRSTATARITSNAPEFFTLGSTTVTFTAEHLGGNHASCSTTVAVADTRPVSVASLL